MSQWYLNPVGSYTLVAGLAIGLLLVQALARLSRERLSRGKRLALVGLRLAVIVLLVLALLRPTLVHTQTKKQSATLVILTDRSRSMLVTDGLDGKSRWEMLAATLADAAPELKSLADEGTINVKVYAFDAAVQPVDFNDGRIDLGDKPDGEQTAIGEALEDVLRREAGNRLLGVILLSDGAQRAYAPHDLPPQNPARRLADLGYPLYTLTFGQARGQGQARDVAVKDMLVNQTVYVKNQLTVNATVRLDGFVHQKIPVQLLFESPSGKMEVVGTQEVSSNADGEAVPVEFSTIPQEPGEYKVTLRAAKQDGELVLTNNELSTFVTVLKGGLNVLYIEGELRVEQKFLRRSLDASPDIKVDYIRLDAEAVGTRGELDEQFRRGKYDVYILGDVDSKAFHGTELVALAKTVQSGAGLVMLGGYHAFGPGGYQTTPLADLLPIAMDRRERQQFNEPVRSDVHLPGPIKMLPAKPLGIRHFVMSLADAAANRETWEKLPPLAGANKLGALKPRAQLLADTPDGKPLLVAQEAGGRVMAFAGDSTWHWWMQGHEAEHKRFWRQVVLWLARKDEVAEGNVWVKLDQRRYNPNARVEFTAGARDPQGDPASDAEFTAEVVGPDGQRQSVVLLRQGETVLGSFGQTQLAGDYTVAVTAGKEGAALGTAKARFLVLEQDLELDNAAADPTAMATLARMTKDAGGQSLAPEELPQLLKQIREKPLELEVEIERKDTPWDTWPFFLVFVGLLSAEWYLRKKWGLV